MTTEQLRSRLYAHCTLDSRYARSPAWRKAALLARIQLDALAAASMLA